LVCEDESNSGTPGNIIDMQDGDEPVCRKSKKRAWNQDEIANSANSTRIVHAPWWN
jgi:hypothetical protein